MVTDGEIFRIFFSKYDEVTEAPFSERVILYRLVLNSDSLKLYSNMYDMGAITYEEYKEILQDLVDEELEREKQTPEFYETN